MGQSRPLLSFFSHSNSNDEGRLNYNYINRKSIDVELGIRTPGPQDGRRWRFHWAMSAAQDCSSIHEHCWPICSDTGRGITSKKIKFNYHFKAWDPLKSSGRTSKDIRSQTFEREKAWRNYRSCDRPLQIFWQQASNAESRNAERLKVRFRFKFMRSNFSNVSLVRLSWFENETLIKSGTYKKLRMECLMLKSNLVKHSNDDLVIGHRRSNLTRH